MMASEALDTLASQNDRLQFVTHKWDLAAFGWPGVAHVDAGKHGLSRPRKVFHKLCCYFGYLSVSVNTTLTYDQLQGDNGG